MNQYVFLAGRILFGGICLLNGIDHFRFLSMMTPYAAAKGVPAPRLGVIGGGIFLILGGLSIIFGIRPDCGVLLLTLFLLPTTFLLHNYWAATDPPTRQGELAHFKKNMGLLGAGWMILFIPQPWPLSLSW